ARVNRLGPIVCSRCVVAGDKSAPACGCCIANNGCGARTRIKINGIVKVPGKQKPVIGSRSVQGYGLCEGNPFTAYAFCPDERSIQAIFNYEGIRVSSLCAQCSTGSARIEVFGT